MAEYISIDRIEGGYANCEYADRTMRLIPLEKLPPDAREGDCFRVEGDAYLLDVGETMRRKEANRRLLEQLLHPSKDS